MIYKIDYFGFIYEWTDSKTGMKYIGSHYGSTEDSYKGSNQRFLRAIKKRYLDFSRKILEYVSSNNIDVLLECEQKWLDSIENIKDNPKYYNKKNEAKGGWSFISDRHVQKRSNTLKEKHSREGLSEKERASYKKKIQKRLERISTTGFTEKEKEQHFKYSYQIKVVGNNNEYIFDSCVKATKELGINAQYGLEVCKNKSNFKGYQFLKLRDPIIDCRRMCE